MVAETPWSFALFGKSRLTCNRPAPRHTGAHHNDRPLDFGVVSCYIHDSSSERRFRGPQAAASLKPIDDRMAGRRADGFRGPQAAASLKRTSRTTSKRRAWGIPRPPSRGLIEALRRATSHPTSMRIPRPPSRGLIEARKEVPPDGYPRRIPRPPSRGLIEAWSSTASPGWPTARFRGPQAAASLKPGRACVRRGPGRLDSAAPKPRPH